jgi:hypothetical protein
VDAPSAVIPRSGALAHRTWTLHDMNWRIFPMIVGAALLSGCISGVPVSIENQSSSDLTEVVVSGKGFSESAGTIRAGGSELVHIHPKVETGIKVAFAVDGQRYSGTLAGTIENDNVYTIKATVSADLSISVTTELR